LIRALPATLILLLSSCAFSQQSDFGIGVILGNPTGISVKYWTGERIALDASLGYMIAREEHLMLSADFLAHLWSFDSEGDRIRLYLGAGAGLGFISDISLSLRLPLGASYFFSSFPMEFFAELDPLFQLTGPGGSGPGIGGYLGAHWYF
jgi:hypothetical protein